MKALIIIVSLVVTGCGSSISPQDALIDCKTNFYAKAGMRDDLTAPITYLNDKGEACSACMRQKGYEQLKSWSVNDQGSELERQILEPLGLWSKRFSEMTIQEQEFAMKATQSAYERARALSSCYPHVWHR